MERIIRLLSNKQGYVLVGAVVVGLAVAGLATVGAFSSSQALAANRNMIAKTTAFYATDGVITAIVQDIIDGNPQKYFLCRWLDSAAIIGSATVCAYKHPRPASDSITQKGGGIGATAVDAGLYFRYVKLSGDIEMKVKVVSMTNSNAQAKAGLMIRGNCTAGSKYAMMALSPPPLANFQYRATAGVAAAVVTSGTAFPRWLKLVRKAGVLSGYHSNDGITWSQVGGDTAIAMGDTVRVGLAVASGSTTLCKAIFDSLDIGHGKGVDTIGNVRVSYTMDRASDGGYDLVANASRTDASGKTIASMPLKQHFGWATAQTWEYPDTGKLHVTLYDYHSNGSNPNFSSWNMDDVGVHTEAHLENTLDADLKPVLRTDLWLTLEEPVLGGRINKWWRKPNCPVDSAKKNYMGVAGGTVWRKPGTINHFNEWFRVSGGHSPTSGADTCDLTVNFVEVSPGKWRWKKADGSDLDYDAGLQAYVGPEYYTNPNNPMKNCIVYAEFPMKKGIGIDVCAGDGEQPLGTTWGGYGYDVSLDRFPLRNKGFSNDRVHKPYCSGHDDACRTKCAMDPFTECADDHYKTVPAGSNYGSAAEMHAPFTYHAGLNQCFLIEGGIGWIFVNGQLVYGNGVPVKRYKPGDCAYEETDGPCLDSVAAQCNLVDGEKGRMDLFYVALDQEWTPEDFYTDIDFLGQRTTRSSWRRDYGRLD